MRCGTASVLALATSLALAAPAAAQPPTMDSLWPNDDGRAWRYEQHYQEFFPDPKLIDNQVRIIFDGTTTAPNGISTQYLREDLVAGPVLSSALGATVTDRLLLAVWTARPDLRARIQQAVDDAPCPQFHPVGQLAILLGGEFAWRKTVDEVAAWRCNVADTRSWLWLVSDLTLGHQFTLQLLPDLATDVYLHGTIAAIEPVTVPAGTYLDCVRVDYVIDYGMSGCTDESGNLLGTSRGETRGHVHFAPGVGPVESSEQFIPYVEVTGSCGAGLVGETSSVATVQLHSSPTPVLRSTWGRLKTAYR